MAAKSLKYFMRPQEDEVVTVPGPESFRDENGQRIEFQIRKLSQTEIDRINEHYRERKIATDSKGNPLVSNGEVIWKTERDGAKATRHLIAEALVYPNLKDKELMEYYKCIDITEMPRLVFSSSDEYSYVMRIVLETLGIIEKTDSDDLKDAKN